MLSLEAFKNFKVRNLHRLNASSVGFDFVITFFDKFLPSGSLLECILEHFSLNYEQFHLLGPADSCGLVVLGVADDGFFETETVALRHEADHVLPLLDCTLISL